MIAKRIAVAIYAIILILRSAMLIIMIIARMQDVPAIAMPDERWQVGSPLPSDARCYWEWASWRLAYCEDPTTDLQVRFNLTTNQIERLTKNYHDVTLGQIIASWGQPIGANIYPSFIYVYYPDCYIVIYPDHFSPRSIIYYVAWDISRPTIMGKWPGFVVK